MKDQKLDEMNIPKEAKKKIVSFFLEKSIPRLLEKKARQNHTGVDTDVS